MRGGLLGAAGGRAAGELGISINIYIYILFLYMRTAGRAARHDFIACQRSVAFRVAYQERVGGRCLSCCVSGACGWPSSGCWCQRSVAALAALNVSVSATRTQCVRDTDTCCTQCVRVRERQDVAVTTGLVAVTTGHVAVTRCVPKILTGDMLSGIHSGRCTSPSLYRSSVQAPVYIGVQAPVCIEEEYPQSI